MSSCSRLLKLVLTAGWALTTRADEPLPKISPYLLDELIAQNTVKVDVWLEDPISRELLHAEQIYATLEGLGPEKVTNVFAEGFVAELTFADMEALADLPEVKYIMPSIVAVPFLDDAVGIVDADLAWQHQVGGVKLTGEGKTVCVGDFMVDFSHPDLASKNILGSPLDCLAGPNCPPVVDPVFTSSHGTHIAGIVAASGNIFGIGKGADVISLRVFIDGINSAPGYVIKRSIDWCVAHAEEYNIAAITFSLGSNSQYQVACDAIYQPLADAIAAATAKNIPVTFASGNGGNPNGIAWPACVSSAIAVGATHKNGIVASYSNHYGPLLKLFAPGTGIYSTCFNGGYCTKSGTSMSTPMVAGAIAILQQFLGLTKRQMSVDEIETLLYETGDPVIGLSDAFSRVNINSTILAASGCAGLDCDDGDACTIDFCDLAIGACVHQSIACDDANDCTIESCDPAVGECMHQVVSCDDGDPCTVDECDASSGCALTPIACPPSSVCINGECIIQGSLDIKPGGCPNSFNPTSNGVLPVALVGMADFDVSQVVLSSIRLGRPGFDDWVAPHEGPPGPHSVIEDVTKPFDSQPCDCGEANEDGIDDLSMKFKAAKLVQTLGLSELPGGLTIELVLTGQFLDGSKFQARDCVLMIPHPPGAAKVSGDVHPDGDGEFTNEPSWEKFDAHGTACGAVSIPALAFLMFYLCFVRSSRHGMVG